MLRGLSKNLTRSAIIIFNSVIDNNACKAQCKRISFFDRVYYSTHAVEIHKITPRVNSIYIYKEM